MKNGRIENASDAYTTPNIKIFRDAYNAVKALRFDNLPELEETYPAQWKKYADSVRAIIGDVMKSSRNIYHGSKRNTVYISNAQMVDSLRTSGFKFYSKKGTTISDEIMDEIFSHIILNSMYFLNRADDAKGAYLLISRSVTNKLVNMTHEMNRWLRDYPVHDISSLSEMDEAAITKLLDASGTEDEIINKYNVETIRAEFIHAAVNRLFAHPDRMIAYLAGYLEFSVETLLANVQEHGYSYILSLIIEEFQKLHVDLSCLHDANLNFKKPHETVTRQDLYNWKMRAMNDLKPLLAEFSTRHTEL